MPVGGAHPGGAKFTDHLFLLAPTTRRHEISRAPHVEADLALLFSNLHLFVLHDKMSQSHHALIAPSARVFTAGVTTIITHPENHL